MFISHIILRLWSAARHCACDPAGGSSCSFPQSRDAAEEEERTRREEKSSGAVSPVYNNIMEPKWTHSVCKRVLLTGFTLCVVLGECRSPRRVRTRLGNV